MDFPVIGSQYTYDEAARVMAGGKALLVAEKLADEDALSYAMDATADEWSLRDYVAKGIEVLGAGDVGFFMMCEGGKIDWACHANDCAAAIHDVMTLEDCVAEAVAFYEGHPDETLIVVTGDHETGGLTIGYAAIATRAKRWSSKRFERSPLTLYQSFSKLTRTLYGRCSVLLRSGAIMDARKRPLSPHRFRELNGPCGAVTCDVGPRT